MNLRLVRPALEFLPSYVAALESGWSPDNIHGGAVARRELTAIAEDAAAFVARLHDPEARGAPVVLPDGSSVPRLPGYRRWIWDGEFCGSISLRWRPGGASLPSHTLGHIGYVIVEAKRGRGYATRALGLLLPEAAALGLDHVDLVADPENIASQKVITANGGQLISRFEKPGAFGGGESLLFRIPLQEQADA